MPVITCPNGCESALPVVKFDDCSPTIVLSEIQTIFLAKNNASAFADVESPTEWATRLSMTTTDEDAIRPLTVIADKPAGAPVLKELSNGRKKVIRLDQTLNVEIDDVTNENYNFMRVSQCGGKYKMWYKTAGGKIYGGNEGISDVFLQLNEVLGRGKDEIEKIQGTVTWSDAHSPERGVSPI